MCREPVYLFTGFCLKIQVMFILKQEYLAESVIKDCAKLCSGSSWCYDTHTACTAVVTRALRLALMILTGQNFLFQFSDWIHPRGHHRDTTSPEHGQVLEGATCGVRDPQVSGGAHEECSVQEASAGCGLQLSALEPCSQETQD